jgi:hypothetical protein
MTSSGTYAFNPSVGEATLHAFMMCGVRPSAILQEHMQSARMAANLLLSRWSAQGVNLWKVELNSIALVQGTATYSVPANVIVIMDGYITQNNGGPPIDRYILPISRSEYASYSNKTQQGFPSTFWFDRLLVGNVTLWPVPDGNEASFNYYCVQQIEDAAFTSGQTADIPYYFLEAFTLGLAHRLAIIWAPDRAQGLKLLADESYMIAATQNTETANTYISPMLQSYWSN